MKVITIDEQFQEWLYLVCEYKAKQTKHLETHDVYQTIDLTEAKLKFMYGVLPEHYEANITTMDNIPI